MLIYQSVHKTIAKKYGCKSTFRIWGIKRFWFTKRAKVSNLRIFGKKLKTNSLSNEKGVHTTSISSLYELQNNTKIIDSPGMRDIEIKNYSKDQI